jgi:hypothetical protein
MTCRRAPKLRFYHLAGVRLRGIPLRTHQTLHSNITMGRIPLMNSFCLTHASAAVLRRVLVAAAFAAALALPALPASTTLAAAPLEDCNGAPDGPPVFDRGPLVVLDEGACVNFSWGLDPMSKVLSDGSRGENFQVVIWEDCVRFTMTSDDFSPDFYVYDDIQQSNEVGSGGRRGNQFSTVVQGTGGAAAAAARARKDEHISVPLYYVLATSGGSGEQFGNFQLDIRGC